ncbi:hypothetical protein Gpo141_00013080 [Globisporangium polare]
MDEFSFDDRDALVTADIDLIMDDEPCDTMPSDAVTMWQDDAAHILFADANPAAMGQAFASPVKPQRSSSGGGATNDWRQPHLRTDSRPSSARGHPRKHVVSGNNGAIFCRAAPPAVKFEPSHEPCTDDIPYSDLVFWLGDTATGEVECSCAMCAYARAYSHRGSAGFRRYSPYERLSSKIPIINLPRIEGVN